MKYVIDPMVPFEGAVVTRMHDDIHSDYGNETLEELREREKNPNLITVDPEKVTELANEHREKLNSEPFKEISEDRYEDLLDCLPPKRMLRDAFFVGEPYQYDLYPFCFKVGGRYFEGRRIVSTPKEILYAEINKFYQGLLKSEANGN